MKKTTKKQFIMPRLYCNFFGHDYKVSKEVTNHVKEYTCSHCKKEVTTNSNGRLTDLTPKYKEINAILERVYTSRCKRLNKKTLKNIAYQES